jgi:hypothetical protein
MEKHTGSNWSWSHLVAAFALTFWLAFGFAGLAMPHASQLKSQGRPGLAWYFNSISFAFWLIAFFAFLPRRGNTSGIAIVQALGRLPLLLRFVLMFALAVCFFWLGILCERFFA